MAKVTLLGREFDIAPYKLGDLRKAAPFMDAIQERANVPGGMVNLIESASDLVRVLSIGLIKIDPILTPEYLDDQVGLDDLVAMQTALTDVSAEAGLKAKGEEKAPPAKKPAGASKKNSTTSSTD